MRQHSGLRSLSEVETRNPMIGCDLQSHPHENNYASCCVRDCKSRTIVVCIADDAELRKGAKTPSPRAVGERAGVRGT